MRKELNEIGIVWERYLMRKELNEIGIDWERN
jgi:hypothetical protein